MSLSLAAGRGVALHCRMVRSRDDGRTDPRAWRHPVKSMARRAHRRGVARRERHSRRPRLGGARRGARRHPRREEDPGADALRGALPRGADAPSACPRPRSRCPTATRCARRDADAARARQRRARARRSRSGRSCPRSELDHYRRGAPDARGPRAGAARDLRPQPDEPLPDLVVFPPELFQFESPPGTYFDAFPLLAADRRHAASPAALAPEVARRRAPLPARTCRDRDRTVSTASSRPAGRASALRVGDARARGRRSPARAA